MITRRDVFQAIADPTRRAILALLMVQTMSAGAIAAEFDNARSTVSKHLQILTECELVAQQQKGKEIYYHLQIDKMKEIDHWLSQFRKIWESRFNELDQVLAKLKKNN
ncbi:transcriptional regulator [Mucilaginibacter sp. PPCGB 2223]|uniref:ArsR/SmtB family transcription factor n=1 Tax=Mucilaginibacter sp. PPCGB 2223 TaxID=1886027 RepID=UPI000825CCD2|nr:metalloregulator ArsR/SmtB family transcription factor [Mucilaginibacter sp. PPCGB 2223]OCX54859.1 transcriptional regulator [Mucilaginibacter sp. PPCGB 2223]